MCIPFANLQITKPQRKNIKLDIITSKDAELSITYRGTDNKDINIKRATIIQKFHLILPQKINNIKIETDDKEVLLNKIIMKNTSKTIKQQNINGNTFEYNGVLKGKKSIKNIVVINNSVFIFAIFCISFTLFMLVESNKFCTKNFDSDRIRNIDFFRIIFSCFIAHSYFNRYMGSLSQFFVECFFIMSGYFLYNQLQKPFKDFVINRFIRLYPLIFFSLLINVIFNPSLLPEAFISSFMLAYIIPNIQPFSSSMPWYIFIMFWSGIFIYAIKDSKYKNLILGGIILYTFAINQLHPEFGIFFWTSDGVFTKEKLFIPFRLMRGISGLSIGYFLFLLPKFRFNNKYLITFAELFFVLLLLFYPLNKSYEFKPLFYCLVFSIIFILFINKQGILSQILDNNFISSVGKYGYAIYLTNESILVPIINKVSKMNFKYNLLYGIDYKAFKYTHYQYKFEILMIVVAVLLHHLIEKPLGNWMKEKYNKFSLPK